MLDDFDEFSVYEVLLSNAVTEIFQRDKAFLILKKHSYCTLLNLFLKYGNLKELPGIHLFPTKRDKYIA